MGDVYLAEDLRIKQQVAIKVIRDELIPYPNSNSAPVGLPGLRLKLQEDRCPLLCRGQIDKQRTILPCFIFMSKRRKYSCLYVFGLHFLQNLTITNILCYKRGLYG